MGLAAQYNFLGQKEEALDWLERAVEERTFQVLFLKTQPAWESLHSEPRFHELRRRVRLE